MRRREFLTVLGATMLLRSVKGDSADEKIPRIGVLTPHPAGWPPEEGLHQGLRELGYIEDKTIMIEWRRATEGYSQAGPLAVELTHANLDVIVAVGTPAARALEDATATTPIVFVGVGDAVGTGVVKSLAKPGANATGVTVLSTELAPKRLDLLRQLAPRARRIVYLQNFANPGSALQAAPLRATAQALGFELQIFDARSAREIDAALHKIPWKSIDGVLIGSDAIVLAHGARIAQAVRKARLPAVFPWREFHEFGVLMSYGSDLRAVLHRAAYYLDKILKGASPGDLPVEQVSKVDLIIDLRVARESGIAVPQELLYRADQVIR